MYFDHVVASSLILMVAVLVSGFCLRRNSRPHKAIPEMAADQ
jgi:hypothetical protein